MTWTLPVPIFALPTITGKFGQLLGCVWCKALVLEVP